MLDTKEKKKGVCVCVCVRGERFRRRFEAAAFRGSEVRTFNASFSPVEPKGGKTRSRALWRTSGTAPFVTDTSRDSVRA